MHIENTQTAVKAKKVRLQKANSIGFEEIQSAHNRKVVWYYYKNLNNIQNYSEFYESITPSLLETFNTHKLPIKFNLKIESTYSRPNVENSSENRAFKTSAREIFVDSNVPLILEESFNKLKCEEEEYTSKGSGFSFQHIDGMLLGIYTFTPMSGSSYLPLPASIDRKRATINPQNSDQQCFKWVILAKHVTEHPKYRVGVNYYQHVDKYNFDGISFPTPLSDVKIFECNNPSVSVNIYGIEKKFQPPLKFPTHTVFPLKVADNEKEDHFDILFITDSESSHYVYISNFSRLIRSQKTRHDGHTYFCKRCFISFDNQNSKYKLKGQMALDQHKKVCGIHKPILPVLPTEGETLEFKAWKHTVRHPIVIYADFEALLEKKKNQKKGKNTTIFQEHKPMSFGLKVVASEDVPMHLLDKFDISTTPIIFRGCKTQEEVAKKFIEEVTELTRKIEKLLKTNEPIIMRKEDWCKHRATLKCDFCKCDIRWGEKVRDHCHLSGKFRYTLCNKCNLDLQQPNFVPCFLHNLTNYDAHFIITELGYDSKTISVIPNSEEKFISFSKDICLKAYCIDPAYYYTAPGMAFDCMLKKTGMKLELLTDYDMVLAFEKGIRGGLVQASMRYAKANHEKAPDFDSRKPNAWLVYQDCNNLYGWAMSEYMPFGDFKWVDPTLNGLDNLDDTSPIGRIYEVDVIYPQELHDHHNDLPFLPENGIPASSKIKKLMATFKSKKNYIVYYRNLQQAIENGLKVEKVHRVLQFKQSPWLAEYISMNTEMRKLATNDFEKDFFKLMNNAVFDLIKNPNLLDRMDTANLPPDHPCYIANRKKVPGLFSDETDGHTMTEFCALRAKSYAYKIIGKDERGDDKIDEKIKAKGIRGHVVKKHMTLEDHKKCLFGEVGVEVYKENVSIRSFNSFRHRGLNFFYTYAAQTPFFLEIY
ncbi:hypothetical protein QTP88_028325 [Uroleucon formosanum]